MNYPWTAVTDISLGWVTNSLLRINHKLPSVLWTVFKKNYSRNDNDTDPSV